jgi:predicted DNA-binding WGR domain protein
MPIKLGKKSYKNFASAKEAIKRTKGLSEKRASGYVASVERAQGKDPRTGKKNTKRKTGAQRRK